MAGADKKFVVIFEEKGPFGSLELGDGGLGLDRIVTVHLSRGHLLAAESRRHRFLEADFDQTF